MDALESLQPGEPMSAHQPPVSVVAEVSADLESRAKVGLRKYGVRLEGRDDLDRPDWLQHAYEEALDMACYLKCLIRLERKKQQLSNHAPPWTADRYPG